MITIQKFQEITGAGAAGRRGEVHPMLVGCRSCRSSGRPSTSKLERIMTKAADDVIEKQTKINGSLVDLETER